MGLFGPPDVEQARATGKIEDLLRAATLQAGPCHRSRRARGAWPSTSTCSSRSSDTKNIRRLQVAREALVVVGPPARDRLIFILGEGHVHRRQDAAFVLGEMRDPAAVAALHRALHNDDGLLRLIIVQALAKIGGDDALVALRQAIFDPEPKVADEARKAVKKLTA